LIICDTSGLLAAMFSDQDYHEECAKALLESEPPRILSPFVVAELDYMILKYAGVEAEIAFMKEIEDGVYQVADLNEMIDFHSLRNQLQKYASLKCGVADISTMLLASVNNTLDVLTLDERHFRALRTPYNKPLRLLPFDSNVVSVRRKRSATTLRRL